MTEHTTTMPDTAVIAGMVEIERLRRENNRLREALRHYADQDNWSKNGICLIGPAIAHAVLQEVGNETNSG